jgi:hypothetical protein
VLTNVQITGNTASRGGGGMANIESSPVLTNVTIAGNHADDSKGGGIYCFYQGTTLTIRNSIIWGNTATTSGIIDNVFNDEDDPCTINYSYTLLQGAMATTEDGIISFDDPKFVSASAYRLDAGSPAIDKGNNGYYKSEENPDLSDVTTDLAGNPRIQNCTVDLGAYEYVHSDFDRIIVPDADSIVYVKPGVTTGDGS